MLKPVQAASSPHLSEHCCSDDDEIVSNAVSNAHITSPFSTFLPFMYDITVTELSRDVTGIIITSSCSSSNSGRNIIVLIFALSGTFSKTTTWNVNVLACNEWHACPTYCTTAGTIVHFSVALHYSGGHAAMVSLQLQDKKLSCCCDSRSYCP